MVTVGTSTFWKIQYMNNIERDYLCKIKEWLETQKWEYAGHHLFGRTSQYFQLLATV